MRLVLKRVASTVKGMYGVLLRADNVPFALTAERPWLNNMPNVSCIPKGTYTCRRIQSAHFGNTFEITDVPNRTHILLHKGNVPQKDSEGCILVGEQFGSLGGSTAVLSSKAGYNEMMRLLGACDFFILDIIEV